VDERERRLRARVLQVGVVAEQLRRRQHALVDDRAARQAGDDEVRARGLLGDPADHVELALERLRVAGQVLRGGDDELLDVGREVVGGDADVVLVDRDVAPADGALALLLDRADEELLELLAALRVLREKADGDAVVAEWRQPVAEDALEQLVGHLEDHPRAVARVRVGPRGATVLEVLERVDGALDRLVGGDAVQPRDEGDAAGIVLVTRIVESDGTRRPGLKSHGRVPEGRSVTVAER
jgi:hypothetical protein